MVKVGDYFYIHGQVGLDSFFHLNVNDKVKWILLLLRLPLVSIFHVTKKSNTAEICKEVNLFHKPADIDGHSTSVCSINLTLSLHILNKTD